MTLAQSRLELEQGDYRHQLRLAYYCKNGIFRCSGQ